MLNANECQENARRFMQMSAEASDLIVKQRLAETAEGWARLAADLAKIEGHELLKGTTAKRKRRRSRY
jgi:hypothetical protein